MNASESSYDFYDLLQTGCFSHNAGAQWLNEHKDDPYWMAHQLMNSAELSLKRPWPPAKELFMEYWQMARDIKDSGCLGRTNTHDV